MLAQAHREHDEQNAVHDGERTDHEHHRQGTRLGPHREQNAESYREDTARDEQPFVGQLFAQLERADDLHDAGRDRPAGNEEQKKKYLTEIARGEIRWCQGYSEPGAGSDLAGLQTRAEDKGDHYLVNGQKVWTSYADQADWIFCLVRTSTETKHGGISFLLFDMESPGVSTKPILLISGSSPFCETFFDDVKVPKDQVVGEVNKGWDVAKYLLGHEREMISGMGLGSGIGTGASGVMLGPVAKPDDPLLRAEIAAFDVDALAFAAMSERYIDQLKAGEAHPALPSMMKYAGTELNKQRNELVMAAGGSDALEWESERSKGGKAARDWLRSKANSIEGGTSEIQLGIVAKHILRLPGA